MSISKQGRAGLHSPKRRKLQHQTNGDDDTSSASDAESIPADGGNCEELNGNGQDEPAMHRVSGQDVHVKSQVIAGPKSSGNMLQVQLQNLLSSVNVDHDRLLRKSKSTTDLLLQFIADTSPTGPMTLTEASIYAKEKLHVKIPWTLKKTEAINYSFEFKKPSRIALEGVVPQKLSIKGDASILIVAQMPKDLFQDKDYLNQRALRKRAFYLACIASNIQQASVDLELKYAYYEDNELLPVLRVVSNEDQGQIFEVCPSFPDSLGPLDKTKPMQNCLRKDAVSQASSTTSVSGSPFYNGTIRHLASMSAIKRLVDSASNKADNFRQACQIGAVWLQQRGFSSSKLHGGFGLQEWALLCALLLESGGHQGRALFSPRYSAIQLFKALLQVLSTRDMTDPFILRGSADIEASQRPVIYDATTGLNIMYKVNPWSYAKLKHYATASLAAVNSKNDAAFEATFVATVSEPVLQYDECYEFQLKIENDSLDEVQSKLFKVLQRGLGDRVKLLDLRVSAPHAWKVSSSIRKTESPSILIGLSVQSDTATRLVDHGPSVEDKVASEDFREFWGEKAELRRFKDGRINESVVWSSGTSVTKQIVQYLIAKYLGTPVSSIQSPADLTKLQLRSRLSAEEAFAAVNTKFQSLSSTLHHLDGLPLPIRSVSAASQYTRSASIILPLEAGLAKPIDVFVQFDTSGRWPDDLRAIQYTKIAFLTKIGDLLTEKDQTLQCRVGLEHSSTSTIGTHNTSFLDVVQKSTPALPPFVFRLRIYHDRELYLVQQVLSSKTAMIPPVRETYQAALNLHKRAQASISHTTAIRNSMTVFPPLSATIRLLKQFISAHRLSKHIPPETAEIIAAQVFLRPAPWSVPGTATTAFARCLYLLSRWDWSTEPLIVDLSPSQDMSLEQREDLETRFLAWRKMDPNMNNVAWFIGTNLDATGVVWTQGSISGQDPCPPRVVAGRLTALASAATQLFKTVGERDSKTMSEADWNDVFASSVEHFDFVIHLKKGVTGSRKSASGGQAGKFKNLQLAEVLDADTTGIDAVQCYIEDLESAFGHVALFFSGEGASDSNTICGLWRPHVRKSNGNRELKIRLGMSTTPLVQSKVEQDEERASADCEVNLSGMLAEMSLLGSEIVQNITHN